MQCQSTYFFPETVGGIEDETTLIKDLAKFPSAKWHELGVQLNVPLDQLQTIQSNHVQSGGVKRCLAETLGWWYKNNRRGATWGDICAALHAVEEGHLATKVAKAHGKGLPIVQFPRQISVDALYHLQV